MAYEALGGRVPTAVERVQADQSAPLAMVQGAVSTDLAAALEAALAVDPEDRPESLEAWRVLLADSAGGGGAGAVAGDRPEAAETQDGWEPAVSEAGPMSLAEGSGGVNPITGPGSLADITGPGSLADDDRRSRSRRAAVVGALAPGTRLAGGVGVVGVEEAAVVGALAPGTRLEEFEVEHVLGVGGFGVTYLARDPGPAGGRRSRPICRLMGRPDGMTLPLYPTCAWQIRVAIRGGSVPLSISAGRSSSTERQNCWRGSFTRTSLAYIGCSKRGTRPSS